MPHAPVPQEKGPPASGKTRRLGGEGSRVRWAGQPRPGAEPLLTEPRLQANLRTASRLLAPSASERGSPAGSPSGLVTRPPLDHFTQVRATARRGARTRRKDAP